VSEALTDGGQGRWIEAKTIITTIGTRFNMSYLAVLADVTKEPAQESIVANRRTIAHKCDMPPCPGNGYIHAPVVTKEPYRSQGVGPNLTGLTNKHHFSLRYRSSNWDKKKNVLLIYYLCMILCRSNTVTFTNQKEGKTKLSFTIDMTTASASLPWKLSMVDTSTPEASGYSSSLSLKSCTCAM
jgi:hypothetical protein